jgi:hypothetical protein
MPIWFDDNLLTDELSMDDFFMETPSSPSRISNPARVSRASRLSRKDEAKFPCEVCNGDTCIVYKSLRRWKKLVCKSCGSSSTDKFGRYVLKRPDDEFVEGGHILFGHIPGSRVVYNLYDDGGVVLRKYSAYAMCSSNIAALDDNYILLYENGYITGGMSNYRMICNEVGETFSAKIIKVCDRCSENISQKKFSRKTGVCKCKKCIRCNKSRTLFYADHTHDICFFCVNRMKIKESLTMEEIGAYMDLVIKTFHPMLLTNFVINDFHNIRVYFDGKNINISHGKTVCKLSQLSFGKFAKHLKNLGHGCIQFYPPAKSKPIDDMCVITMESIPVNQTYNMCSNPIKPHCYLASAWDSWVRTSKSNKCALCKEWDVGDEIFMNG